MSEPILDCYDTTIRAIMSELIEKIERSSHVNTNSNINTKLMQLIAADSSSSSDSDSDSASEISKPKAAASFTNKKAMRIKKVSSLGGDSSSSSDPDSGNDDDDDENSASRRKAAPQKYLKTKDETTIDDLPPLEKLNLVLDRDVTLVKIGRVISIVDSKLVVIQSVGDSDSAPPPLDEDTVLFDANRKGLGKIYETFGPVASPFYSLRFNLNEIKESALLVDVGSLIFFAPDNAKYTKFIFNVDELRQAKGSDASWNHDNEPPVECVEYSDDEQEQLAKRQLKMKRAGRKLPYFFLFLSFLFLLLCVSRTKFWHFLLRINSFIPGFFPQKYQ